MCQSCFGYGNRQILVDRGFSTFVPANTFVSSPTYSDFMFWKCISPEKVTKALDMVRHGKSTLGKQVVTDEDFRRLAEVADSGNDVKIWGVSIKKLLGSIKFDQAELDNATCKIAFLKD